MNALLLSALVLGFALLGCTSSPMPTPIPLAEADAPPDLKMDRLDQTVEQPTEREAYRLAVAKAVTQRFVLPVEYTKRWLVAAVEGTPTAKGKWKNLRIAKSSGVPEYDQLALKAARDAEPLPLPPQSMKRNLVYVELRTVDP